MSEARKGNANSLGYRFTEEQKRNISIGLRKRIERDGFWAEGGLLSKAEKAARTKTRRAMKGMVRRVLTMARVRKDKKSETLLGYSKAQLRVHLESQFSPGMSWEVRESFHIDHIIPVKWFLDHGISDPAVINALSNLQVLPPLANRKKNARLPENMEGRKALLGIA